MSDLRKSAEQALEALGWADMTPTNKLRFVEREQRRVLQQWWEGQPIDVHWVNGNPGKWRDVPLEEEK